MATHDSTYFRGKAGSPIAATLQPAGAYGSDPGMTVRVAYGKLTGGEQTLAQDDFVNLFRLPAGAVAMYVRYVFGSFGSSVTLDIGDVTDDSDATADENKFESAVDVSAGSPTTQNWLIVDDSAPNAAPTIVRAKFEGANPGDASDGSDDLEVWLMYAAPGTV